MKTPTALLAAMVGFWGFSICHAADEKKLERAVTRVRSSVIAFEAVKHRYPHNLTELQAFAAPTKPLDLSLFTTVDFQLRGANSLHITLQAKSPLKNSPDTEFWLLGWDRIVSH